MRKLFMAGLLMLTALGLAACATTKADKANTWKASRKNQVYSIAGKQQPPEPVYNPGAWVRPPEVLPSRTAPVPAVAVIMPVIQLELKNVPLAEAAKTLGEALKYRSYCASQVAGKRVSLNAVGTIDELAKQLAELAEARELVDHNTREIRFFASSYVEPHF